MNTAGEPLSTSVGLPTASHSTAPSRAMNITLPLRWAYKKMRKSLMLAVELADQLEK
jgi:hypothetical protein